MGADLQRNTRPADHTDNTGIAPISDAAAVATPPLGASMTAGETSLTRPTDDKPAAEA